MHTVANRLNKVDLSLARRFHMGGAGGGASPKNWMPGQFELFFGPQCPEGVLNRVVDNPRIIPCTPGLLAA